MDHSKRYSSAHRGVITIMWEHYKFKKKPFIIKTTRSTSFLNLFLEENSAWSGQDLVPSWSCSQAVSKPVWHIPLLCVQWETPDDGQRNCPKHVEFYSKNKFEKLVHLVGFIIRIYHDARSPEHQIKKPSVLSSSWNENPGSEKVKQGIVQIIFFWFLTTSRIINLFRSFGGTCYLQLQNDYFHSEHGCLARCKNQEDLTHVGWHLYLAFMITVDCKTVCDCWLIEKDDVYYYSVSASERT